MTDDYYFRNVRISGARRRKTLDAVVCRSGKDVAILWIDGYGASPKHHWHRKGSRRAMQAMLAALAREDVSLDNFVKRLLEKWNANPPRYRCTFCMGDCWKNTCSRCKSDASVYDKTAPHRCEWSRKTIKTVECKVCDRTLPMDVYLKHGGEPPDKSERRSR